MKKLSITILPSIHKINIATQVFLRNTARGNLRLIDWINPFVIKSRAVSVKVTI